MANGFSITISAVDRASKVMDNITKRINAMNAPLRRFRGSAGKFLDASGINRVAGAFRGWAAAGLNVAGSLVKIVEPLGILTSVASLAGIYKLTSSWAQFGSRLGFDAQRIGIMPQKLQALQGAAEEAGSSAQSLTSGMRNLRDGMVNALGGRDPQTFQTLFQLFPEWNKDTHHLRQALGNLDGFLPQVANKIASIKDPTLRARLATQLFGSAGEDLMPFLLKGSKGINELTAKMAKYGLLNQDGIEKANKLRESMVDLRLASVGLSYAIAQQVGPSLGGLLDWFTNLISVNRATIAANIGKAVKVFADWVRSVDWKAVGSDINDIFTGVNNVANAMGGWGSVATLVTEVMVAKMFAPILFRIAKVIFMAGKATKALQAMAGSKYNAWADAAVDAGGAGGAVRAGGKGLLGAGLRAGLWGAGLYGIYESIKPKTLGTGDTVMRGGPLPKDIEAAGRDSAHRNGIDPNTFLSLLQTENGGYNKVSSKGAFGSAQLMPATAASLGLPTGIDQPGYSWKANIEGGARYLAQQIKHFHGNVRAGIAAYNAGAGNPGVIHFAETGDASKLPNETQGYVRSIETETGVRNFQDRQHTTKPSPSSIAAPTNRSVVTPPYSPTAPSTYTPGSPPPSPPVATPSSAGTQSLDKAHLTMDVHVHSSSDGSHRVTIPSATVNGQPIQPKIARAMPASGY